MQVKKILSILTGAVMLLSSNVLAGDTTSPSFQDIQEIDPIEFGFVLLPDESQMTQLESLRDQIAIHFMGGFSELPHPVYGDYVNQPVTLPHVSMGQYGVYGVEIPQLKKIVHEVAQVTPTLNEPMCSSLSITDENVFFDFAAIREHTNPPIIETYKNLRTKYMNTIRTKFMIAQAAEERLRNSENTEETKLIDECFQNWGTPEGNRIRPHFTMLYNYTKPPADLERAFAADDQLSALLAELGLVTFTRLAIVQIDFWGNPIPGGIIAQFPLKG